VKIIRGDFNMTKSLKEKKKRICRLDGICTRIVDKIEELQLMNSTHCNGNYTWNSKRGGIHHMVEK
jgi:hypothetical protein